MNTYEKLQEEACKNGIDVIDYPFESNGIKGLYCDGTVAIRDNIDTTTEKPVFWQKNSVTTTLLSVILLTWNIPVIENKSDRHGSGDTIAASDYSV